MKKVVLFVSMDGCDPFGETFDTEVEAVDAAVDIKAQDIEFCSLLDYLPTSEIACVLYTGDPLNHEVLEFLKEV